MTNKESIKERDEKIDKLKAEITSVLSDYLEPDAEGETYIALLGILADSLVKHIKLIRRHSDPTQPVTKEDLEEDLAKGIQLIAENFAKDVFQALDRSFAS